MSPYGQACRRGCSTAALPGGLRLACRTSSRCHRLGCDATGFSSRCPPSLAAPGRFGRLLRPGRPLERGALLRRPQAAGMCRGRRPAWLPWPEAVLEVPWPRPLALWLGRERVDLEGRLLRRRREPALDPLPGPGPGDFIPEPLPALLRVVDSDDRPSARGAPAAWTSWPSGNRPSPG